MKSVNSAENITIYADEETGLLNGAAKGSSHSSSSQQHDLGVHCPKVELSWEDLQYKIMVPKKKHPLAFWSKKEEK